MAMAKTYQEYLERWQEANNSFPQGPPTGEPFSRGEWEELMSRWKDAADCQDYLNLDYIEFVLIENLDDCFRNTLLAEQAAPFPGWQRLFSEEP